METTTSNPVGRPPIQINWTDFDSLVQMHCTEAEIAHFFKCSIDTISRACHQKFGMNFADYYKTESVGGRRSLRRLLWQNAFGDEKLKIKPHAATAIFLSKQREERGGLNFSDKVSNEHEIGEGTFEDMVAFCDRKDREADEAK